MQIQSFAYAVQSATKALQSHINHNHEITHQSDGFTCQFPTMWLLRWGGNPPCTNSFGSSLYPLKWYHCAAHEAGLPAAIYRKASHLYTCMAELIHYQRFQIPKFLYETVTSFDLIYRRWRGGQSCWKKRASCICSARFGENAINIKATQ